MELFIYFCFFVLCFMTTHTAAEVLSILIVIVTICYLLIPVVEASLQFKETRFQSKAQNFDVG